MIIEHGCKKWISTSGKGCFWKEYADRIMHLIFEMVTKHFYLNFTSLHHFTSFTSFYIPFTSLLLSHPFYNAFTYFIFIYFRTSRIVTSIGQSKTKGDTKNAQRKTPEKVTSRALLLWAKNERTFRKQLCVKCSTQGQILEAHDGLATRSAASVSLWEPLCMLKQV